jgi:hypothetical protein
MLSLRDFVRPNLVCVFAISTSWTQRDFQHPKILRGKNDDDDTYKQVTGADNSLNKGLILHSIYFQS